MFIVLQGYGFGRCSDQGQRGPLAEEKLDIKCWAWWKFPEGDVKSVGRDEWWVSKWNGKVIETNPKIKSLRNRVWDWTTGSSLWKLSRSKWPPWAMQETVVMPHTGAKFCQHTLIFYLVVWEIWGGRDFRNSPFPNLFCNAGNTSKPTFFKTSENGKYFCYLSGFPNPLKDSAKSKTAGLGMPTGHSTVVWLWAKHSSLWLLVSLKEIGILCTLEEILWGLNKMFINSLAHV